MTGSRTIKYCILISTLILSSASNAASHRGLVEKVDLHSNSWTQYNPNDKGMLSIYIQGLPKACNDAEGLNRVIIESDHPLFDGVLSLALAAKLSDTPITINYLSTCNVRNGAWDFGYISF